MAGPGSSHQTSSSNWRHIVTSFYPDALTRTYCVPPVHFNRVPYVRDIVPGTGHSALVLHPPSGGAPVHNVAPVSQRPVPPAQHSLWSQESDPQALPGDVQESDLRDDFAQNHVMQNLQQLGSSRRETMFILSQLSFGDYLNQPAYAAAAAQLPRPSDLDTRRTKYSAGEADFVLIHRQHGILIGELKAVGRNQAALNKTQAQADADVAKKVKQAVKQLERSETVVRHLVSDVAPGLTVRKTLFLPYVRAEQLERVLNNDPQLQQEVCQSLDAASTAEAVQLCCCSDQLSQPASYWDVTPAVLSQLSTWWQHRMACTVDTVLTDDTYLDIVARFVGPATTVSVPCYNGVRVEVRTAGQAVKELGWRLALLVLTLGQLHLLNRDPPRVHISGPPGTGKTVMLVLQGLRWLLQGHDVFVVSAVISCRAVSTLIKQQLQLSLSADPTPRTKPGTVTLLQYDFYNREADVERAVSDLLARVKQGSLHVLMDEANFDSSVQSGRRLATLVSRLAESVPSLHLWASGIFHTNTPPALQPEALTVPLRCAPAVLREVQQGLEEATEVHKYSDSGVPAPGDGPCVIRLSHHGNAHTGRWPDDCFQCGKEIAAELRRLGVGSGGSSVANSPAPLSYRDVFVLTQSRELHDNITDDAGRVTSAASDVVRGLRAEGLPVCVLGHQDFVHNAARRFRDLDDMGMAASDRLTAAHWSLVPGLERRVVAVLAGKDPRAQGRVSDADLHIADRIAAASRCSTQLIMVDVPPPSAPTSQSNNDSNDNAGDHDRSRKDQSKEKRDNSDTGGVSWAKRKGFLL